MAAATATMEVCAPQEPSATPALFVGSHGGRTSVEVNGHDIAPEETSGWTAAGKRLKQVTTPGERLDQPRAASDRQPRPSERANFAKRVAATITKAARMPAVMPREEIKIVMRPRGGLNVARTGASIIMSVIMAAARVTREEAKEDTICTNAAQNIIVVSTPNERRADVYSNIRALNIGGSTYEINAYRTAPEGTVKGVIRGVAIEDTPEEINDNIVNQYNPLAVEAHRIGNTTTVIVLFAGQKVPNYVKYGSMLVRCALYRKHFEVCRKCGKVGHRSDVCPYPNTRICFACGAANPGADHERECKPHCKLCGGQHPTGERECKNRYKKPFVVTKRQWERKIEILQQQRQGRVPEPASFPPLAPRRESRQRSASRRRDRSNSARRGRSASRRRRSPSQPREKVAWADAVKTAPTTRLQSQRQQQAKTKTQEESSAVTALRAENEKLKQKIVEQVATINEINEKLAMLISMHQQLQQQAVQPTTPQPQPQPTLERHQEIMNEDEPEPETDPRAARPSEPNPKRRAVESARDRRINARLDKQDERLDRLEANAKITNERLTALEQTTHAMNERLTALEHAVQGLQNAFTQLQAQIQAQIQGLENEIIAKLQQLWMGQPAVAQQLPQSQPQCQ
ncbi:uncharacterized protein LOC144157827 [Haemaphysalis longicornis]